VRRSWVATKLLGWGFANKFKGHIKANIDVDPNLGDAFSNSVLNSIGSSSIISNNYNQRVNTTSWGEIVFSSPSAFENENSSLNGGLT
jgi:hypothetical protein